MEMHKVIIGVSGGPDSMYLLNKLISENNYKILVVHINYHIRKESDSEEKKLLEFCKKNEIEIFVYHIGENDWEEFSYLKNKQSITREQRFNQYLIRAQENNIKDIYIAHHKDDFLETAIMKKRKSSEYPFYGIRGFSVYKGLNIHRPLLHLYKGEILEFLNKEGIPYSIDKSNLEPIYERNKLRIKLLKKAESEKNEMVKEFEQENLSKNEISIKVAELFNSWNDSLNDYHVYMKIPDHLKKFVIYEFLIYAKIRINISSGKILGIIDFLKTKKGNKEFRLMENIFLVVKSNIITIIYK